MIAIINKHAGSLELWYDASGRRCVAPPDGMVISWELRKWYGMFDVDEERAKANAQAKAHRLRYGNEQLSDDIAHDKRRKGNRMGKQKH